MGGGGGHDGPSPLRRFDQVALGQALPSMTVNGPADAALGLLQQFVAAWAGREAIVSARVTRCLPARGARTLELAGRVYGRHLDGSRRIEIEVVGRDGLGARLGGMVQVRLA
ncbi:MAG: hypothetical protein JF588_05585 [Caulobacterales bacterium]|jgi:hypothetical protein|nr:hypothetical protein [Caulobacterales bacterium]